MKMEIRRPTIKLFHSKVLINNEVFSLIIDNYGVKSLVSRKLVSYLNLPIEFCPIRKTQVCWVPISIGKSYKHEVFCELDDMEDCHIRLGKSWRQEVQGFYDLKRDLYVFSWEGKRIAMIPCEDQPHVPMDEVKIEENIFKTEVFEEHIKNIKELQVYKLQEDMIANLASTKEVVVLKTCEDNVMDFNDIDDVNVLDGELSMDSEGIKDLMVCDFDYEINLNMIITNPMKVSMVNKEVNFILIEDLVVIDKEFITRCSNSYVDQWECGKKYEGSRVNAKRKSTEDKVRREKVFEVDEALDSENTRASSFLSEGGMMRTLLVVGVRVLLHK